MKDRFRKVAKSMHFRVLIILLVTGLVPINLIKSGILKNYEHQTVEQRAYLIRSQCTLMGADFIADGYLDGKQSDTLESRMKQVADRTRAG